MIRWTSSSRMCEGPTGTVHFLEPQFRIFKWRSLPDWIVQGNCVVIMDEPTRSTRTDPRTVCKSTRPRAQVVYAKRRSRQEPFWKRWTANAFYRTLRAITQIDIPLDTGDFRLISRKVLLSLADMQERDRPSGSTR